MDYQGDMAQFFPHEKLDVYAFTLTFAEQADKLLTTWSSAWAVYDHFDRASDSIVTNLAKAARFPTTTKAIYNLECSLGSVLECAACLDVALSRHLIDLSQVLRGYLEEEHPI